MASRTGVRIQGIDKLMKKVTTVADLRGVKAGIKAAGEHVEGVAKEYPPRSRPSRASVYGQTFASDKQRRFFFAALRDGRIDIPYRRGTSPGSETHGRRWSTKISNNGLRATVGNNTSYGPLLQDEKKQSRYAAVVGWKTQQEIAKSEQDTVLTLIRLGVRKDLSG